MKVSIDTKEDSHEEIKKVIKMLQNLVGDSQEVFTNDSSVSSPQSSQEPAANPFANIFGDSSAPAAPQSEQAGTLSEPVSAAEPQQPAQSAEPEDESESTEDLFAELFSEEELKKMDVKKEEEKEDEEVEPKSKSRKY